MRRQKQPEPLPELEGFDVLALLGGGFFSEVYLVERDDYLYALKLYDDNEEALAKRDKEFEIGQVLLDVPNIAHIYEKGDIIIDEQMRYYLLIEYIDGHNLNKTYRNKKMKFNNVSAIKIIYRTLKILRDIHAKGVLHSDLDFSNILLFTDIRRQEYADVRLIDFSEASFMDDSESDKTAAMEIETLGTVFQEFFYPQQLDSSVGDLLEALAQNTHETKPTVEEAIDILEKHYPILKTLKNSGKIGNFSDWSQDLIDQLYTLQENLKAYEFLLYSPIENKIKIVSDLKTIRALDSSYIFIDDSNFDVYEELETLQ